MPESDSYFFSGSFLPTGAMPRAYEVVVPVSTIAGVGLFRICSIGLTRGGTVTQGVRPKDIFSTHDAARICRVTPMTVIRWIKEGKIPAFRTAGGHRRILVDDLARFCAARGIPFAAEHGEAGRVLVADADPAVR